MRPRIVAENDPADVERTRATTRISHSLREHAANLMRVARGAGKPDEITRHLAAVVAAFEHYREVTCEWPDGDMLQGMLVVRREPPDHASAESFQFEDEQNHLVAGALQIAASRLLAQRTQEAAGSRQLYDTIRAITERRTEKLAKELARRSPKGRPRAAKPTKPAIL